MIWQMIGVFAGGVLFGITVAMLMKARGMQSREEEMREYFLAELEKAKAQTQAQAAEQAARKSVPNIYTALPRAILDDPHFQKRLEQAGKDFSADYAKGIEL